MSDQLRARFVDGYLFAGSPRFTEALLKGYNTEIGEHGVGLSGGQKRRHRARHPQARPRAGVRRSDEQPRSRHGGSVRRTINQLKGKMTVLLIAHLVPNGLQVDEVIRLGERAAQMRVVDEERSQ